MAYERLNEVRDYFEFAVVGGIGEVVPYAEAARSCYPSALKISGHLTDAERIRNKDFAESLLQQNAPGSCFDFWAL